MRAPRIDITGQKFGRLTAKSFVGGKQYKWLCECSCGIAREVDGRQLRSGATKSCGCLRRDVTSQRKTTHGLTHHPLYATWQAMKARCYNPNHKNFAYYGAKGTTVCDRWLNSPTAFFEDMGERPDGLTVDRINTKGNYEPENCRWATRMVQVCNRQNNHIVPGVSFIESKNKYHAAIAIDKQSVSLGYYKQHSDAAYQRLAYESLVDQGATGEHLKLLRNFIRTVTGNKKKNMEPLYA